MDFGLDFDLGPYTNSLVFHYDPVLIVGVVVVVVGTVVVTMVVTMVVMVIVMVTL